MTEEYLAGKKSFEAGHSIHSNPYRHKGTAQQFNDYEEGHKAASKKEADSDAADEK